MPPYSRFRIRAPGWTTQDDFGYNCTTMHHSEKFNNLVRNLVGCNAFAHRLQIKPFYWLAAIVLRNVPLVSLIFEYIPILDT